MSKDYPILYATHNLSVEFYDQESANLSGTTVEGDVDFYREFARQQGGPILELGCGTGRVTWPVAELGLEVVGLEISEAMLEQARLRGANYSPELRERVSFVLGDMSVFSLDRTFSAIIVPFRAFQCLLDPQLQRSCLGSARNHLAADGKLVLDLFDPILEYLIEGGAPKERGVTKLAKGGELLAGPVERRLDPQNQLIRELWKFTELDETGRVLRESEELLELRWTYRQELYYLLELTGFSVTSEYSDFKKSPPAYGKELLVIASPKD